MRKSMKSNPIAILDAYDYHLPDDRIACFPRPNRSDSRLLCIKNDVITDRYISDLLDVLRPGDRLVVNNTKVMKARIHTHRKTGGAVEVFITKIKDKQYCSALIRPSRRIKEGEELRLDEHHSILCLSRVGAAWRVRCTPSVQEVMDGFGSIPIPPYFKREANEEDEERYQSIFADQVGAVAASTASLHMSPELRDILLERGIDISTLTLHIGMGTFSPLREEQLLKKKLHKEWFSLSANTVEEILETKKSGGRVIAVGTTVTRCLESVAQQGELCEKSGETDLFIQNDFSFRVIDGLLTNFHLPKSSLLMLVCSFGGRDSILDAYQHAIENDYRFYSYGDAMLILSNSSNNI
jgi:S-adenosylmethionine:tRNA ribosyltransferase-isomerase